MSHDPKIELVVLLHGLGRTARAMGFLQRRLAAKGFATRAIGYPSMRLGIGPLAALVARQLEPLASRYRRVHFVTHSLGGILARQLVRAHDPGNRGRIVQIAPPNHGSAVVDGLRDWWLVESIMGPAFVELSARDWRSLGDAPEGLAIIAGTSPAPPFSMFFHEANDGKVAVSSARLRGAEVFREVPETHTQIITSRLVAELAGQFLLTGEMDEVVQAPRFGPNVEMETLGGKVFWITLAERGPYRLQQNRVFGNCRVLRGTRRIASGNLSAMKLSFAAAAALPGSR